MNLPPKPRKHPRRPLCPCCLTGRVEPEAPPDPDLGVVCGHCAYLLMNVEDVMATVPGMGPCGKEVAS